MIINIVLTIIQIIIIIVNEWVNKSREHEIVCLLRVCNNFCLPTSNFWLLASHSPLCQSLSVSGNDGRIPRSIRAAAAAA